MIKVEKNIPLPKPSAAHWNTKYPWGAMEVGDSFAFDCNIKRIRCSKYYTEKRHDMKFKIDSALKRVWRIA